MKSKLTFSNFYGRIKNDALELGDNIKLLEALADVFKDADESTIRERVRVVKSLQTLRDEIDSCLNTLRK